MRETIRLGGMASRERLHRPRHRVGLANGGRLGTASDRKRSSDKDVRCCRVEGVLAFLQAVVLITEEY